MGNFVKNSLRYGMRSAKAIIRSSPSLSALLDEVNDAYEFSNVWTHERMMADSVRVDAYHKAIARYIRSQDVVADLGTGTGILAIFAARQNARKVYAIDHSPFIEVAKKIACHNGADSIRFVRSNSRSFEPDEPLDVIIHEQMGSALFNENMLQNVLDLKQRALKATGRIMPGRFELYFEPASLDPRRQLKVPRLWECNVHGVDFSCLKDSESLSPFRRPSYDRWFLTVGSCNFLCDPEPLLSFDLNQMSSPDELPTVLEGSRRVVRSGSLDAICIHFRAIFHDDIVIDTSPVCPPTNWSNPFFRTQSRMCSEGDTLHYRFEIADAANINTWNLTID